MKINFRQGLISFQQPEFLQAGAPGFISLIVSPTPFIGTIAHGTSDYLLKFDTTVTNAWGPVTPLVHNYLYLDLNMISGALTYGITLLEPVSSLVAPPAIPGQMWFDLNETVMKVRSNDNSKWIPAPRLMIATVTNGNTGTILQSPVGSSVGLNVPGYPGFLLLDTLLRPLRTGLGELLTTDSTVRVKTTVGSSGVLTNPSNNFVPVRANEPIPEMRLVYLNGEDGVSLASSNPALLTPKNPVGIVESALATNEVGVITQLGEVTYDQWSWAPADFGKPLYCGFNGEVTLTRPQSVHVFRVGHVKSAQTILFYVDSETQPQVVAEAGAIISGEPPIVAVTAPNMFSEIVTTISIPEATTLEDGYMSLERVQMQEDHETRLDAAELDITDLQTSKADVLHDHPISEVTGLQTALDDIDTALGTKADKVLVAVNGNFAGLDGTGNLTDSTFASADFALASHSHSILDVTGLQLALDDKAEVIHSHAILEVTGLQLALDGKAAVLHGHTIADVSGLQLELDDRAFVNHTHTIANVTGLQTALNGKAALAHTHIISEVTNLQSSLDDKLNLAGDTMSGLLVLSGPPVVANGAATRQYVLDNVFVIGSINQHTDVDTTTVLPTIGQSLKWDGSNWVPAGTTLNDLSDVSVPSPATGSVLAYSGADWVSTQTADARLTNFQFPVLGEAFSFTIADAVHGVVFVLSTPIAAGSVTMPSTPVDGQVMRISTTEPIVTLTINGNIGQSIIGSASSPSGTFTFLYRSSNTTWYRIA